MITTLKAKWQFALFAALLYLAEPFVNAENYILEEARGAYPPNADTIAIPIYSFSMFILVLSPVYALGVWLAARCYHGGLPLLAFDSNRLLRGTIWSLLLGGLAVYDIYNAAHSIVRFLPLDALVSLLWAYLLLSLRSSLAGNQMPSRI